MITNPLNTATQTELTEDNLHWLDNATVYALFKALSACYTRIKGQSSFVYRIRNGKSWTKHGDTNIEVCKTNYNVILNHLKSRIKGNKTILVPYNISYALPTSEKMFVGNIPTGTKVFGEKLASGVYWENSWGATDIDLSGLNIAGKIGWNSEYRQRSQGLTYSGDLTNAQNGAVEYLYAKNVSKEPTLVMSNVYSGEADCGYKIIVGKGDNVSRQYMMNPNNVIFEVKTNSVQKNTVLGLINDEGNNINSFTLLNFGAGNARVSGNSEVSTMATKALYEQWKNPLSLKDVLLELGYNVVTEKSSDLKIDFDLSIDKLTKNTFIEIFS